MGTASEKNRKKRQRRRKMSVGVLSKNKWSPVRESMSMRKSMNFTRKTGRSPHIISYNRYGPVASAKSFGRRVPLSNASAKNKAEKNEMRLKYCTHKYEKLDHIHHGQRKLLMVEIEFLVNEYEKYKQHDDVTLVYVGAACGTHITALITLFPMFTYHLYDKVRFNKKLYDYDNVKIFAEYFTNEHAQRYAGTPVIFISDIRNLNIRNKKDCDGDGDGDGDGNGDDNDNELVYDDMEKQRDWYNLMNPLCALLKFRLAWDKNTTQYLQGKLYYQVWQGRHSSETRLSPVGKDVECEYDNLEYDEKMHFFNRITRRQLYKNDIKCYGNCYDCFSEIFIISKYIDAFILPNDDALPKSDDAKKKVVFEYLCTIRYMVDDMLGRKLF